MSAINAFLLAVWRHQPKPGYGTVARKDFATNRWTERYLYVNGRVPRLRGTAVDDLYFSPCLFSQPNHQSAHALASRWLYADLDEVNPHTLPDVLTPTLAWQTSWGRYQCLWLLDRPLEHEPFEAVNQRLTYVIGADKSGWPASKVLRPPGSINTKHGRPQRVRLVPGPHPQYRYETIAALVRHARVPASTATGMETVPDALPRSKDVLAKWGRRLPPTALRALSARVRPADRSGELYHLYPALFAAGMSREEAYAVVCDSVLCKNGPAWMWSDVGRGSERYADARCLDGDGDPRPATSRCQPGTNGEDR